MIQEQKQLLLKDLCGRLLHETYIEVVDKGGNIHDEVELDIQHINAVRYDEFISIRPYLRSMSSMTEEEIEEYHNLCYEEERECYECGNWITRVYFHDTIKSIDWLNEHRFDYRGLIEKGLALEAPKDMYKTE